MNFIFCSSLSDFSLRTPAILPTQASTAWPVFCFLYTSCLCLTPACAVAEHQPSFKWTDEKLADPWPHRYAPRVLHSLAGTGPLAGSAASSLLSASKGKVLKYLCFHLWEWLWSAQPLGFMMSWNGFHDSGDFDVNSEHDLQCCNEQRLHSRDSSGSSECPHDYYCCAYAITPLWTWPVH